MLDRWKARARALKRETYALYLAYRDPRTPWYARLFAAAVVAYALSPIDLIPDFIPVLGYLDDLLLLPGLIWLAIRLLPPEVLAQCRGQADAWMLAQKAKPRSWLGAVLIVTVWIALGAAAWWWMRSK